jgi:hypothetical protein
VRLFVRRDPFDRFLSMLLFVRATAKTASLRERDARSCRPARGGPGVRPSTRATPTRPGSGALHHRRASGRAQRARRAAGRRRSAEAARTLGDRFDQVVRERHGGAGAGEAYLALRRRLRRGLPGPLRRRRGSGPTSRWVETMGERPVGCAPRAAGDDAATCSASSCTDLMSRRPGGRAADPGAPGPPRPGGGRLPHQADVG